MNILRAITLDSPTQLHSTLLPIAMASIAMVSIVCRRRYRYTVRIHSCHSIRPTRSTRVPWQHAQTGGQCDRVWHRLEGPAIRAEFNPVCECVLLGASLASLDPDAEPSEHNNSQGWNTAEETSEGDFLQGGDQLAHVIDNNIRG